MDCFSCAREGYTQTAHAVCARCGAAVCEEHVVEQPAILTVLVPINRPVPVTPAARRLLCPVCAAAEQAQALAQSPPYKRPRRAQ